ncbi:hypothetical protein GCM10010439_56500 [Actinocorallia aurantiaca]|uniref:Uncharacterized protein n=1 Tax=Actinocorallia aurantiaca TaxID=46204 RepID=A0ABN3UL53_9ACTN
MGPPLQIFPEVGLDDGDQAAAALGEGAALDFGGAACAFLVSEEAGYMFLDTCAPSGRVVKRASSRVL